AILRKKAEPENIDLPDEVFSFIAESISSSVRALEGSLIRILAYASYNKLNPANLDTETVRNILSDMISESRREISLDTITQQVCLAYNITIAQIVDKTRRQQIAYPRQIAMYLANLLIPQLSLKEIAEYFKRKDHTTVLHAKKMIDNRFREDINFRSHIEQLIKNIKA
ncbi:MAG TPA: helix-turn-helix domain-containing protein, partial [Candidatus Syntrophosphaera sp.]|nr:helix-turn-helix domain-containing protein [Candidatus Syntrophosphaera sp.]